MRYPFYHCAAARRLVGYSQRLVLALAVLGLYGGSATGQNPFEPAAVQSKQQRPERTWTDRIGRFSVVARLHAYDDKEVKLLKQDGLVVTVPLEMLREADQTYVAEVVAREQNPFAGGVPVDGAEPAERMVAPEGRRWLNTLAQPGELPPVGAGIFIKSDRAPEPIEPDVDQLEFSLPAFTRQVEKHDAYAKTSPPILLSSTDARFAVSVHRVGNAVKPETFGRVFVFDAATPRYEKVIDLDETIRLFDHHIESGRSLAVVGLDSTSERGGDLILLQGLTSGSPSTVSRWKLPSWDRPGFKPKVEFAKLLDDQSAVVQTNNAVHVWDLLEGDCKFHIADIRNGAKLAISSGGKYLAVGDVGYCRLVDLTKGELVGSYAFPNQTAPQMAFSPDGKRLALGAGNLLTVWDLTSAKVTDQLTTETSLGDLLGWVDAERLLTSLAGLVDLSLDLPVWRYTLPSGSKPIVLPGRVLGVDGMLSSTFYCMKVPHESVQGAVEHLNDEPDSRFVLTPGSAVALHVQSTEKVDLEQMLESLRKAVEAAGWSVQRDADITVEASIGRGETQALRFRTLGQPFLFQRGEKVKITPYTTSVKIKRGAELLWSQEGRNTVPSILMLKDGQSIKQAAKSYERADPKFCERVSIPPRILRPELRKKIGRSQIRNGRWNDF